MGLKDLFSKLQLQGSGTRRVHTNIEDYVEIEIQEGVPEERGNSGKYVKVCKLSGFADVDISARELSNGNVVILDIKPLAERSMNELKHAVDEMKEIVSSMGGDIAGLSEYLLILTPPYMKIERSVEARATDFEEAMERVRKRVAK
ncbi:MAG: cell division protein SepF [Euryarchaeota archaeon]|nr:cell division protein SepF [Euryarchaeota archaeon]